METTNNDINWQYILGRIVGQKYLLTIPVALSLVLSVIAAYTIPKQYESYAMILLDKQKINDPLATKENGSNSPALEDELGILSKQLYSYPRLMKLAQDLHLGDDIKSPLKLNLLVEGMKKRIIVEHASKDLFRISFRDGDPQVAYKAVNIMVDDLINEREEKKKLNAQDAIAFFTEQLKIYKQKLEGSEWNFTASKVETELRLARNRKELLESKMKKVSQMVPSQITKEQSPLLVRLRQQLADTQDQLARLMVDGKEDNPWILELKKKSNDLAKKINEEESRDTVKESISLMNPLYMQTEQDLKQVDMEIEYLNKRKAELEINGTTAVKPVREDELVTMERNKQVDEDIYQLLLKQMESAYVSQHLQDSDRDEKFRVIESPRVPLSPIKPKKPVVVFAGLMIGIAIGAGLVLIVDRFDTSFLTVDDAGKGLPQPVIGAISNMILNVTRKRSKLRKLKEKILALKSVLFP